MDIRPRRSVLYMPGGNARALEKARSLPADALILDLEDAVAPEAKLEARERVADAVASGGYGAREVVIRINAIGFITSFSCPSYGWVLISYVSTLVIELLNFSLAKCAVKNSNIIYFSHKVVVHCSCFLPSNR